jgi:hypothetical protein
VQEQTDQIQASVAIYSYTQILAHIIKHFTVAQKLQLARALVQSGFMRTAELLGLNTQRFLDDIDTALADLRQRQKDP